MTRLIRPQVCIDVVMNELKRKGEAMYDFSETPKRKVRPNRQVTERTNAKKQSHSIKDVAVMVLAGGIITGLVPMVFLAFVGMVM